MHFQPNQNVVRNIKIQNIYNKLYMCNNNNNKQYIKQIYTQKSMSSSSNLQEIWQTIYKQIYKLWHQNSIENDKIGWL